MKKRLVIVLSIIVMILYSFSFIYGFEYTDDFSSYDLGYDTFKPTWIPQYEGLISIGNDSKNFMRIESLRPFEGDRDIHVKLNKNETINFTTLITEFDFLTSDCNDTWRMIKNISPQAASIYIDYYDEDNFVSVEYKINANDSYCGDGIAQITAFKRINGISINITPYTTYEFMMNNKYNAKIIANVNEDNWNLKIYLDDKLVRVTDFIFNKELKGDFLLESAGTVTNFYDFNIFTEDSSIMIVKDNQELISEDEPEELDEESKVDSSIRKNPVSNSSPEINQDNPVIVDYNETDTNQVQDNNFVKLSGKVVESKDKQTNSYRKYINTVLSIKTFIVFIVIMIISILIGILIASLIRSQI